MSGREFPTGTLGEQWISACRCTQSHFRFNLLATSPKHVPEIKRRRRIAGIAFHQDTIEAFGFGNVTRVLCGLRLLK